MNNKLILLSVIAIVLMSVAVNAVTVTNSSSACSGDWAHCDRAYADDSSLSDVDKNKEGNWRNYGFSLPVNAIISSVVVRTDMKKQSGGSGSLHGEISVSNDGGSTYSSAQSTADLSTTETTTNFDFSSYGWTNSGLGDSNFKIKVRCVGSSDKKCQLDWVPVTVTYTSCGDGVAEGAEVCDAGANNGIACSPPYAGSCDYCNSVCSSSITLQGNYCGDGNLDQPQEACDDGNNANGDGCSSTCVVENNVPEYSGIAASIALSGLGVGYLLIRRKK